MHPFVKSTYEKNLQFNQVFIVVIIILPGVTTNQSLGGKTLRRFVNVLLLLCHAVIL